MINVIYNVALKVTCSLFMAFIALVAQLAETQEKDAEYLKDCYWWNIQVAVE